MPIIFRPLSRSPREIGSSAAAVEETRDAGNAGACGRSRATLITKTSPLLSLAQCKLTTDASRRFFGNSEDFSFESGIKSFVTELSTYHLASVRSGRIHATKLAEGCSHQRGFYL